jgi:hypothetical protein
MALTQCPECRGQISTEAAACPHCGYPLRSAPGGGPATNPIPVPLIPQDTRMWCWAASGQMVMQYLGHPPLSQCLEASDYFGVGLDCCSPSRPDACVNGGWPQFARYGFSCKQTPLLSPSSALSWDDLTKEIDSGRPFAFAWHRKSGGGHMMVAIGYNIVDGKNVVLINDPWPPGAGAQYPIPYESFVAPDLTMEHWTDFYGIVAASGPGGAMASTPANAEELTKTRILAEAFLPTALKLSNQDAPGAAEGSHLDVALPVVEVGLRSLEMDAPGSNVDSFFSRDAHAVLYPVMLRAQLVSSVAAHKQSTGEWVTRLSNAPWMEILTKLRAQHAAQTSTPLESYYLVDAGALGLQFLATRAGGKLVLIPTLDEPDLGFRAGRPLDAATVYSKLSSLAKKSNEEPA